MGIRDWLFEKQRESEIAEEFELLMREYDSSPLPEGILNTQTAGIVCPHCRYELSLRETIRLREVGGVGATRCPKCGKLFKQH